MISILDDIKLLENKISIAKNQYIEEKCKASEDCLLISGVLSIAFNNAGEEVTQDILSYKGNNAEETYLATV